MISAILLAFSAPHATLLVGPLVQAKWSAATSSDQADVFETVRFFEESDERARLALNATLELLNLPRSDPARKRLWRNVPGSGVISDRRVLRMMIVRISSDRAVVDAKARVTVVEYDRTGNLRPIEKPRIMSDRIELARAGDDWQIISVARRIH